MPRSQASISCPLPHLYNLGCVITHNSSLFKIMGHSCSAELSICLAFPDASYTAASPRPPSTPSSSPGLPATRGCPLQNTLREHHLGAHLWGLVPSSVQSLCEPCPSFNFLHHKKKKSAERIASWPVYNLLSQLAFLILHHPVFQLMALPLICLRS